MKLRWLSTALLLAGCGADAPPAEGHVVLHVTTDAPLPAAPGQLQDAEVAPLFNRLQIDVIPAGATAPCAGCSRQVAADQISLDAASFSLLGTAPVQVRLRLFRSGGTSSGAPRPRSTIEHTVIIDSIPAQGRRNAHVVLWTDAVGTQSSAGALPGPAPSHLVGSWPQATPSACALNAAANEVCIPGGAQWLGDASMDLSGLPEHDGATERLVVFEPYFLDLHEVSVAEFRASGLASALGGGGGGGASDNPKEKDTGISGCLYTSAPSETDALPVNCLSWSKAKQYCEALGKRLPTESEYERAASALGRSRFVWGTDLPQCEDAVFARDGFGDACTSAGLGPTAAGASARDRLLRDGRVITDLAGNVAEWMADRWNRDTEACWVPNPTIDPACDLVSERDGDARAYRGGHFGSPALLLHSSVRSFVVNENFAVDAHLGFRCARDGR